MQFWYFKSNGGQTQNVRSKSFRTNNLQEIYDNHIYEAIFFIATKEKF